MERKEEEDKLEKEVRMVGVHEYLKKLHYCFFTSKLLYRREAKALTTAWSEHPSTVNITHQQLTLVHRPFRV